MQIGDLAEVTQASIGVPKGTVGLIIDMNHIVCKILFVGKVKPKQYLTRCLKQK